ncbi:YebC/PmpR family DNA-binding transcriptional regulator [bacterium]|nr:YebC/PmpR family DNA-binding transcriptional regulator [bacterium]
MSGHSKWSTIKRKKGAIDEKRGKIFTSIIKEITIAARLGGGDESANPRLRQAIAKAKSVNMPADNVKRAIKKGTGELPGVNYEEAAYEGYGSAGVAIMMEILTDNKKRTVAEIRHLMSKYGGNLGESGSVAWMFNKKGQIVIDKNDYTEEAMFEIVLECGAEDFETEDNEFIIVTNPSELMKVRDNLEAKNIVVKSSEIELIPKNLQKVEGKDVESIINLMEALEDNEDIKNVYANFDIAEELLNIDQ